MNAIRPVETFMNNFHLCSIDLDLGGHFSNLLRLYQNSVSHNQNDDEIRNPLNKSETICETIFIACGRCCLV